MFTNIDSSIIRLVLATFGLYYAIKLYILLKHSDGHLRGWSLLLFVLWPGMDPGQFKRAGKVDEDIGRYFVKGYISVFLGLGLGLGISSISYELPRLALGLIGLLPLFLIFHFGVSRIITALFWLLGYPVPRLFDVPARSSGLSDFWSRRWNIPFVQMNKLLFLPWSRKLFSKRTSVFVVFLISGFLHEIAISFPVSSGWGLPTIYFLLQALVISIERRLPSGGIFSRLILWLTVLLPLPLLFHSAFRSEFIIPLYFSLNDFLFSYSFGDYLSLALWVAAIGHGIVLCAGIQLPWRLNWREDLQSLRPFNRKILWNYGVFIFLLVIAFGVETAVLHKEMLAGDRAALGLAALIGGFWLLRILADCFYFNHDDWPEGHQFVIGHALLNTAFIGMSATYFSLILWHCF